MSKRNPENNNKTKNKAVPAGAKPGNTANVKPVKPKAAGHANTANPKPKPATTQPTEEKMEIHHHPHLEHKAKPWKEYLIEGFMIFIAVMMGFIAENIRETITNDTHVKQLTSRLVQDLKADTAQLAKQYKAEAFVLKSNDTLFKLLQQPLAKADTRSLQQLIANSQSMWPFHPSAVAIAAIKNELYLKQFSGSEIISYIANYEKDIALMNTEQDITLKYQRSFIDPFLLAHFTATNFDAALNRTSKPTAQMRNLSQEDLTQLGVSMVLIRINTKAVVDGNKQLNEDAIKLLHYVTTRYGLEDK